MVMMMGVPVALWFMVMDIHMRGRAC